MTNAALLLLPLIVLSLVNAISWEGSRATEVDDVIVNRSTLPTGTQSESFEMVKRGQYPMTVCGFIGGSLSRFGLTYFP